MFICSSPYICVIWLPATALSGAFLGKLFTHMCLCYNKQYNWYRTGAGWEGHRSSSVALAMRHRHRGLSAYGLNDQREGDEHHAYVPSRTFTFNFTSISTRIHCQHIALTVVSWIFKKFISLELESESVKSKYVMYVSVIAFAYSCHQWQDFDGFGEELHIFVYMCVSHGSRKIETRRRGPTEITTADVDDRCLRHPPRRHRRCGRGAVRRRRCHGDGVYLAQQPAQRLYGRRPASDVKGDVGRRRCSDCSRHSPDRIQ